MKKDDRLPNTTACIEQPTQKEENSDWVRTTVVIREKYLEKIKALSFMEKVPTKDVLDQILARFFESLKTPIPERKKGVLDDFFTKNPP